MPNVVVSRDGMLKVRGALRDFKKDIEHLPDLIITHSEETQMECRKKLEALSDSIVELEGIIKKNEYQLFSLMEKLAKNIDRVKIDKNQVFAMKKELEKVLSKIDELNQQLSRLRSQLANAETDEQRQAIQEHISRVNKQINDCVCQKSDLEKTIEELQNEILELENENKVIQSEISDIEEELHKLKKEKSRREAILERMRIAFNNVIEETMNLINSTNGFTNQALLSADSNLAGIEQCLQYVEQYMLQNI